MELGPPTGAELNEIGVFMHEVSRWRDAHVGWTIHEELRAFSPSVLYQRASEAGLDTARLYNHFMRAIGYVVTVDKRE